MELTARGYDRNSNRTFARAVHNLIESRVYSYDKLNRLITDKQGVPNSSNTDLLDEWARPNEDQWTYDVLGNWKRFDQRSNDTAGQENRTHNATNEVETRTPAEQAGTFFANDPFSDSGIEGWSVGDVTSGSDGSWDTSSGKVKCDTAVSISTPGPLHLNSHS